MVFICALVILVYSLLKDTARWRSRCAPAGAHASSLYICIDKGCYQIEMIRVTMRVAIILGAPGNLCAIGGCKRLQSSVAHLLVPADEN